MNLGIAEWLTIGSIVVAIILGIAAIVATRRSGKRRKKLMVSWEVVQLVPERSRARGLVVSYEGEELKDPRLVQVILKNVGPSDIASGDFDADQPLQVLAEVVLPGVGPHPVRPAGDIIDVLDMRLLEPDRTDSLGPQGMIFSGGGDYVDVIPMLIRRGASITIDFLVDGPVEVYFKSPLIDTDLVKPNSGFSAGFKSGLSLRTSTGTTFYSAR
ncbi:hypothetical protein ACFFON_06105 [Arthrobacter citreus]|uniref:hypothetical protein n=1 Tax=Arthrobacter TaxID=1663 RepID=UPI001264304A|nr:hypothetical protein [Arthrobacter gandavensis]